jgi:hypothetical protein
MKAKQWRVQCGCIEGTDARGREMIISQCKLHAEFSQAAHKASADERAAARVTIAQLEDSLRRA